MDKNCLHSLNEFSIRIQVPLQLYRNKIAAEPFAYLRLFSQCVRNFRLKSNKAETHSEDVAASRRHHLLGGHHGRAGVNGELLVLVTVDDAVGDVAICAQVPVIGKDAVDGLAALVAVSLRQADAVGHLGEGGRVVILVLDVNYDPHGGLAGGERPVDDCDLG